MLRSTVGGKDNLSYLPPSLPPHERLPRSEEEKRKDSGTKRNPWGYRTVQHQISRLINKILTSHHLYHRQHTRTFQVLAARSVPTNFPPLPVVQVRNLSSRDFCKMSSPTKVVDLNNCPSGICEVGCDGMCLRSTWLFVQTP